MKNKGGFGRKSRTVLKRKGGFTWHVEIAMAQGLAFKKGKH